MKGMSGPTPAAKAEADADAGVSVGVEESARAADDFGHIVASRPLGVLTARSADAIRELVAFAGPRQLPVAARGGGHAPYGQGQASGGYVVDMRALSEVRCTPGDRTLSAGAGAPWSEVLRAALAEGLAPPVVPDHLGASVGGVLSTGGFGATSHRHGLVADAVTELEVVTGAGALVTCSGQRDPELFHAVLAGLGQCALIVRATLRLVPARPASGASASATPLRRAISPTSAGSAATAVSVMSAARSGPRSTAAGRTRSRRWPRTPPNSRATTTC